MKNFMFILLCLFVIILISSCGIEEGTVIGKEHQPERTWNKTVNHPVMVGKITTYQIVKYIVTDDEDWIITIINDNKESKIYVSKHVYDIITANQYVYVSDLDGSKFDPTTQKRTYKRH